jgi:hypothetical protein
MWVATAVVAMPPATVSKIFGTNPGMPSKLFSAGVTSNIVMRVAAQTPVLPHGGWFASPFKKALV